MEILDIVEFLYRVKHESRDNRDSPHSMTNNIQKCSEHRASGATAVRSHWCVGRWWSVHRLEQICDMVDSVD